jgi:hypothetical protein
MFTFLGGHRVIKRRHPRHVRPQIAFDLTLILRGGRHDLCLRNEPVIAESWHPSQEANLNTANLGFAM